MTISSQTFNTPLPPEDADMTHEEGRLFISRHSTKAWNDLEGEADCLVPCKTVRESGFY